MWEPPAQLCGEPVSQYTIERLYEGPGREWHAIGQTPKTAVKIKSLDPQSRVLFRVKAVNPYGESDPLVSDWIGGDKPPVTAPTPKDCDINVRLDGVIEPKKFGKHSVQLEWQRARDPNVVYKIEKWDDSLTRWEPYASTGNNYVIVDARHYLSGKRLRVYASNGECQSIPLEFKLLAQTDAKGEPQLGPLEVSQGDLHSHKISLQPIHSLSGIWQVMDKGNDTNSPTPSPGHQSPPHPTGGRFALRISDGGGDGQRPNPSALAVSPPDKQQISDDDEDTPLVLPPLRRVPQSDWRRQSKNNNKYIPYNYTQVMSERYPSLRPISSVKPKLLCPPKVTAFHNILNTTGAGIQIMWTPVKTYDGLHLHYKVEKLVSTMTNKWTIVANTTDTSHWVTGLPCFSGHKFRVSVMNTVCSSEPLVSATIYTNKDRPSAPVGPFETFNVTNKPNQLIILWKPPERLCGGPLSHYTIEKLLEGLGRKWQTIGHTSKLIIKIKSLNAQNRVRFRVKAVNPYGESEPLVSDWIGGNKPLVNTPTHVITPTGGDSKRTNPTVQSGLPRSPVWRRLSKPSD
ncbi:unnamed protein product, partial [Medioppia subpectinata]